MKIFATATAAAAGFSGATAGVAPRAPPPPIPSIAFNSSFGSDMVLQRAPAKSCVIGTVVNGTAVSVTVAADGGTPSYDVPATVTPGPVAGVSHWKACLMPASAGGSFTVTATCTAGCDAGAGNLTAAILRVTFGDVWYCGGQSNMALPLLHTLSRNISRDAILDGKYGNLRIHGIAGNMNGALRWTTLKDAIATNPDSDMSAFGGYSSTCYYFGESLSDELAAQSADGQAPPIGLIHTSFGGSTIEQWLDNATIATCTGATLSPTNQEWHDQRVLPYVDTTVKGWVWYQGENDMHGFFGNSAQSSGYGCQMQKLVAQWRKLWSATPGTTPANAPFGLVTLAPSGTEGGKSIGTMRWAQTANYGVVPNPALPNVFMAQAYDLNDPFSNTTCYHAVGCHDNTPVPPGGWPKPGCDQYCASVNTTNWYMGPIHPRDKKPVGLRLAKAAAAVGYGAKGTFPTGPTLSGCSVSGNTVTLKFNKTLLTPVGGGDADALAVQPYYKGDQPNYPRPGSKMQVLVNASLFCMQLGGGGCLDDGTGQAFNATWDDTKAWVTVDVAAGLDPSEVVVDLARTNGTAFAIRYANDGDCCSEDPPNDGEPCPTASCPLMGQASGLPANPFIAKIGAGGKCACIAPQVCDE